MRLESSIAPNILTLPKTGGCAAFRGELRPHLIQRNLVRVLPPYQVHLDLSSRLATIDMGKNWVGWCALFFWGSWFPIEHKVAWAEVYLHTKWHLSPSSRLDTTDIGRKLGMYPFLGEGELGPQLTHCRVDRGLPPYPWHFDASSRSATIKGAENLESLSRL